MIFSQIRKNIAKCSISLDTFLEDLGNTFNDNEENFKRHCFYLYNNNRQIIGLIDLSISLVKRTSSIVDRLKTNQVKNFKKPQENKNKEMYATFGTKSNKVLASSNLQDVKQTIEHEVQTEFYEKTQEIPKNPTVEQKENNLNNANTYVNPTLKVMLDGNFCPPPMFLIKKVNFFYFSVIIKKRKPTITFHPTIFIINKILFQLNQ